mgnify:CR=1 FL=1
MPTRSKSIAARFTASGRVVPVATVGTNVPSWTNSGLAAGTTYWYRVVALSSHGERTSAVASAKGPRTPA